MHILAPLISGKENCEAYIEGISRGAEKITLLQVIDRDFMNKTSAAMGEVMQFSSLLSELKRRMGQKRKSCQEITEWGHTAKKILSIALIQNVDKVVLIDQKNEFMKEILKELKKNKVTYDLVELPEPKKKK
jgi:hypothetical protein